MSPSTLLHAADLYRFPEKWTELPAETFKRGDVYEIALTVDEPTSTARAIHPVTSGVPCTEGAVHDDANVQLLDADRREIPLQTQVLARWPDGSIKWLLLDFQTETSLDAPRRFTLRFGKGVTRSAVHANPVMAFEMGRLVGLRCKSFSMSTFVGARALAEGTIGSVLGVFSARSDDGAADGVYSARVEESRIEEAGPLRAVLRVSGWHDRADGRKSMPFIMRLTMWAGIRVLGLQHTFIVSENPLTTYFRGIGLQISCPFQKVGVRVRDHERLLPKEISVDEFSGRTCVYLWPEHGPEMDLRPVLVRQPPDFIEWTKKYPDGFQRLESGPITSQEALETFNERRPIPAMGPMIARTGEGVSRTHEIFITSGPDAKECDRLVRAFDRRLFAIASPTYYASTCAMGRFHPRDPQNFPAVERAIETHLEWIWKHQHEWSKWHGIFDYGDYPMVYDAKRREWWKYDEGMRGWSNGEVNTDHGPFVQFLRSGDRRCLDFGEAMARHRMDVDQCHFNREHPEFVGGVHRHQMTEHWNGLIDGGHLWADSFFDMWCLFGYRRGLECGLAAAEFAIRWSVPYVVRKADTSRETANGLRVLARAYEATRDEKYKESADAIARGYLCCFDETGGEIPEEESLRLLKTEFSGTKWESMPYMLPPDWKGHVGYQYIGYLGPAIQYWATMGRTEAGRELARRVDQYAGSIQGDAGQFYGERYLETRDARYLIPLLWNPKWSITVLAPLDGRGDQPDSYGDARMDYLYGLPYILAAIYAARAELTKYLPKPSGAMKGYRAAAPIFRRGTLTHQIPLDLSNALNRDARRNPFGRPLLSDSARKLDALKPGQIGFQPYRGCDAIREGYQPVSVYQRFPATAADVAPNHYAPAGLPLGARVEWAGVPYQFASADSPCGKSIVVLGSRESVTFDVGRAGTRLHLLGHVHGRKESRRISQFSPVLVGAYDLRYADGSTETIELTNGVHFDSVFGQPYAGAVEHVASFDWFHTWANMTDDKTHLNVMTIPLKRGVVLESVTFRSSDEDWGLMLAAATIEGEGFIADDPPFERITDWRWSDVPGFPDVKGRRIVDDRGVKLPAPNRLHLSVPDDGDRDWFYEIELTISGDPEGCPRLRVECDGRQVLGDFGLAGGGERESIRILARARGGEIALDLIPGQNYATGSLFTDRGFVGSYGAFWSPNGNFVRIESVRLRRASDDALSRWPQPTGPRYGWLLAGASGEAAQGGLVVDHEDGDEGCPTTMKWRAGGFRADLPDGRYKVIVHHTTYAPMATVFIEIFANGQLVIPEREVAYESVEFESATRDGAIEITWRQPRTHVRVPRYAIRGVVFEKIG